MTEESPEPVQPKTEAFDLPTLSGPRRWTAEPRRALLRDELSNRATPAIAAMYWEAVRALDNGSNGERYVIAGHLLREVQDHLPGHLEVPQATPRMRLGDVFRWLRGRWNGLVRATRTRDADGRWGGSVDGALARFLWDLGRKVSQYEADQPKAEDLQRRTLGHLDPALAAVPEAAQRDVVQAWRGFHDVFTSTAHHAPADPDLFEETVEAFEALLGDRLVPRTFEKQDLITQLVREAEGRADA